MADVCVLKLKLRCVLAFRPRRASDDVVHSFVIRAQATVVRVGVVRVGKVATSMAVLLLQSAP